MAARYDESGPRRLALVQLASIIVRPCSFGDAAQPRPDRRAGSP